MLSNEKREQTRIKLQGIIHNCAANGIVSHGDAVKGIIEILEEEISSAVEKKVWDIRNKIDEAMFQIRENGTGETYKSHKALFDLKISILEVTPKK